MNASTDWLIEISSQSAEGLLVWSSQALVLMTCVWLGLKMLRVKSPALRHHIWLFSLIALALLPPASEVARRFPSIRSASPLTRVIEAPRMVIDLTPQANPQTASAAAPFAGSDVAIHLAIGGCWAGAFRYLVDRLADRAGAIDERTRRLAACAQAGPTNQRGGSGYPGEPGADKR